MRVGGDGHDAETILAISIQKGFFLKNVEVHARTGPLKTGDWWLTMKLRLANIFI